MRDKKRLFAYNDPGSAWPSMVSAFVVRDQVQIWTEVPFSLLPMHKAEELAIALLQATPDRDRTVTIPEGVISAEDQLAVGIALIRAAGRTENR
jgi:hypothetical protein